MLRPTHEYLHSKLASAWLSNVTYFMPWNVVQKMIFVNEKFTKCWGTSPSGRAPWGKHKWEGLHKFASLQTSMQSAQISGLQDTDLWLTAVRTAYIYGEEQWHHVKWSSCCMRDGCQMIKLLYESLSLRVVGGSWIIIAATCRKRMQLACMPYGDTTA